MFKKYFGTDGVRGKSNGNFINPQMMIKFAMASSIASGLINEDHKTVIIGKDTRLSGYMLEYALTSGFISMGINVILVGPIPTPAISALVKSLRVNMGIMISASHNPYFDNGIKLFDSNGYKITAELEQNIEDLINKDMSKFMASSDNLGSATRLDDAKGRYIEQLKHFFPQNHRLDGIKIVVDCANGAAYDIAPKIFRELGAETIAHATNPNGFNINKDCGVMHPNKLCDLVRHHQADIGIALDGDADRVLIIDENGKTIEGEQILALFATTTLEKKLASNGNKVVSTILANMGLEQFLKNQNIELLRTDVGDKNVVSMMQKHKCSIGGEPSGHIILGKKQKTGDGIRVALGVLAVYKDKKNIPISKLLNKFTTVPQVTKNIIHDPAFRGQNILNNHEFKRFVSNYQEQYKNEARIILRPSGTEPVIRLLIESLDKQIAQNLCIDIEKKINLILAQGSITTAANTE